MNYGANESDWENFVFYLPEIAPDLLPVVSNLKAAISEKSTLKAIGKTPSLYNANRRISGIKGWTSMEATPNDIEDWKQEPDYGICIQTRQLRAFDIDIDDEQAGDVLAFIREYIGAPYYTIRTRNNSRKLLLPFFLPGTYAKRVIKTSKGIVEFLANGQQFVAVGTHPSGVRYEWSCRSADVLEEAHKPVPAFNAIPILTPEFFEQIWVGLMASFGIEEIKEKSSKIRKSGAAIELADPVADFLYKSDLVLGTAPDGSLLIECPWSADHTGGEAGDTSTVWFTAGTNGYPTGHFKCLHAHCSGRNDGDFFKAVGYVENLAQDFGVPPPGSFEPVDEIATALTIGLSDSENELAVAAPRFQRDGAGNILATVSNVILGVGLPSLCDLQIGYDLFRDEIRAHDGGEWRPFMDADYTRLRRTLEGAGFKPIGREMIRDAVLVVAEDNAFDSAQDWVNSLEYDGTPRIETFLIDYFGTVDNRYTRAVSLYMWTALAGRALAPGCKADMVPIFVGRQGTYKSTGVEALAPLPEFCVDVDLADRGDAQARRMRGRMLGVIDELRGLYSRDIESIKSFITRRYDTWIPKYREFAIQYPRRLLFIGTTNKTDFLADETGNRRWLPVGVGVADAEAIAAVRDQLWAEARDVYNLVGICWQEAHEMAPEHHEEYLGLAVDPWEDDIAEWLVEPDPLTGVAPGTLERITTRMVMRDCLGLDKAKAGKREEMRISKILRKFGLIRSRSSDQRGWMRQSGGAVTTSKK